MIHKFHPLFSYEKKYVWSPTHNVDFYSDKLVIFVFCQCYAILHIVFKVQYLNKETSMICKLMLRCTDEEITSEIGFSCQAYMLSRNSKRTQTTKH